MILSSLRSISLLKHEKSIINDEKNELEIGLPLVQQWGNDKEEEVSIVNDAFFYSFFFLSISL